ncbi:MAG: Na/Pi cotransporter family protein [Clostridia bacterium]|nr:Na/Pi cotransporter family protein [Clostridia bacterium]
MSTGEIITALVQLAGGIGILLFGMKLMGDGLEMVAGSKMKSILEGVTSNPFLALLVGALVTAIIQSSAATIVMVMGFLNAKLVDGRRAFYIIMGANIGTTITAFLIGLNIGIVAPVLIFAGAVMMLFFTKKMYNHVGMVILGFGLLFFAMDNMKEAMSVFKEWTPFQQALAAVADNPILSMLMGALMAAALQSSSAGVGIVQAMTGAGLMTMGSAIFNVFGQNIGTCVVSLLAGLSSDASAKRAAVSNLLLNSIGTLIWLPVCWIIGPELIAGLVAEIAPGNPEMQIAIFHISFNTLNTILMMPFVKYLANLAEKIVKDKGVATKFSLQYLDERILATPALAVAHAQKEIERMAHLACDNMVLAMEDYFDPSEEKQQQIKETEEMVNYLNHTITDYLIRIQMCDLSEADSATIGSMFHVVNDFERISDHAENIMEYAQANRNEPPKFSADALDELHDVQSRIRTILDDTIRYFTNGARTQEDADDIVDQEETIDDLVVEYRGNHVDRLSQQKCNPELGMNFIDLLTDLERVSDHATNIMWAVYEK